MDTDNRRPVNRGPRDDRARNMDGRRPQGQGQRPPQGRPQGQGQRPPQGRPQGQGQRPPQGRPAQDRRNTSKKNGGKKMSAGKIVLIVFEVLVLAALAFVIFKFVIPFSNSGHIEFSADDIIINDEVQAGLQATSGDAGDVTQAPDGKEEVQAISPSKMSGYKNIALFGVDSREGALTKNTRSDTIIVASINEKTKECKLVSVFRDTYLNLSNDEYNKCNAAYAKGGPKQAINMLNMNLDLDITDFVTIGFDGLIDLVDAVGGVQINVTDSEIVHLNNYQISMVGKSSDGETFTAEAGKDYTPVTNAGLQTLNGLQATAYCRIRYVGNDFQRTERQRAVIQAVVAKAKANPSAIINSADALFKKVYTSLDLSEILDILSDIGSYEIVDEAGFPDTKKLAGLNMGKKGSCLVPLTLEENVVWLHQFLFNQTDYQPSSAVKSYSEKIVRDASDYM
ncbi:MAG: LCP family protein [Lachnospiraceae bacterium]|nr:LCP family protein [Lachnospiraceae bacterium]